MLELLTDEPSHKSEEPFGMTCAKCPVRNTAKAYGCTTLVFIRADMRVRAVMQTTDEPSCKIMQDPKNIVGDGDSPILATSWPKRVSQK